MLLNVYQVDRSEFEFVVDLEKRHCTCNVFDIDKIPCIHAIAAAKHIKRDENRFVDASHLTETWAKAYAESYILVESCQRPPIQRILMNCLAHLQLPKRKVDALLQRERDPLASLGFLDLNLSPTSAADVAQEGTTRSHARGL
ncbi:unnamed protein product [Brassica napus]|uniref:(rape) hypothetical protein n=1 Tax=Brassica napus TaxID=3708 RepID=A0A816P0F6_BRANA|nr:unnamed protein product [Brassica napus]